MKQYEAWIIKAENDLKSAKKLMQGIDPLYDTSIYHAQQCAEKALKAYLAFKRQPTQKTHDVQFLVELCSELDDTFDSLTEDAILLNPYSTSFRYPDIVLEPDEDDLREAIVSAEKIFLFEKKSDSRKMGEDYMKEVPEFTDYVMICNSAGNQTINIIPAAQFKIRSVVEESCYRNYGL